MAAIFFLLGLVGTGVVIGSIWDYVNSSSFENCFPPMSDDEFVAGCGPGANRAVALKVRRIVSEQLNIPYEEIHPTHRFVEDLRAD